MQISGNSKRRRALAIVLLCIWLCSFITPVLSGLFVDSVYAAETTGIVTGDSVRLRSEPNYNDSDNILTVVPENSTVVILDSGSYSGELWYKVSYKEYTGYMYGTYIKVNYNPDANKDFEKMLSDQGFPESYRVELRKIHDQYPKWVFLADHVDYTFKEVVDAENSYGRSLINRGAISSWKSAEPDSYDVLGDYFYGYDGEAWNLASREIIEYFVDPRNYLDSTRVFAFDMLSYNSSIQTVEGVSSIIADTFMRDTGTIGDHTLITDGDKNYSYAEALMMAGKSSGASPYHLATRIIQEVSTSSTTASGSVTGTVSGYEGYYNYYNQGAVSHSGRGAIENGLIYAREHGWDNRLKAIVEGADFIAQQYISVGQDTLYYEKFDLAGTPFTHQYMTFIRAPYQEAYTASRAYSDDMKNNTALVFKIPVYKNMPDEAVPIPTGDGSPNNILATIKVFTSTDESNEIGITPSFSYNVYSYNAIVDYNVDSVYVDPYRYVTTSKVIKGSGVFELNEGNNRIDIIVKAENGLERLYTVTIFRKAKPADVDERSFKTTLKVDNTNKYLSGLSYGMTANDVIAKCTVKGGLTLSVQDKNGNSKTGRVGTGDKLIVKNADGSIYDSYQIVLYGDVDGNGSLNTYDFIYVRMHILGYQELSGVYAEAADANRGKDGINTYDFIYIRMQILGYSDIKQD